MAALSVLFLGGTGVLSSACARAAVVAGHDLHVLTRGRTRTRTLPPDVHLRHADVADPGSIAAAVGDRGFDVVVDWLAFTPEQVQARVELFRDRVGQYVFISSASAYQTPPARLPILESTPLANPYLHYSRDKIAGEAVLAAQHLETGFPVTVVRPSHTYDRTAVPLYGGWTDVDRMRRGKEVVVHGDGTSLWTLTHHDDFAAGFVPLLGDPRTLGEAFHITSEDPLTWNQITEELGRAAGVEPRIVHVPAAAIAAADPNWGSALLGDRAHSKVFDNSKIRRLVPGFTTRVSFAQGAREIVEWHDEVPARRRVDARLDALTDDLVAAYRPAGPPRP